MMNCSILTLQELSFEVIIQQFSVYTSAYTATKDENFEKNLRFLQRVYSKHLFTELDKQGRLEKEHLDFLLNESLKEVDIGLLLSYTNKENVVKKVTPICHSLVELSCLREYNMPDCIYTLNALLPHAANVTKIHIPYICTDELLKLIVSSCPQLSELDIHESSVTSKGIQTLYVDSNNKAQATCPLKYLDLSEVTISCEDVAVLLQNMPTLEELNYISVPSALHSIHKADIDNNVLANSTKYNLLSLNFSEYGCEYDPNFTSILTMCAVLCPQVKRLTVPISKAEELESCYLFQELENLSLHSYKTLQPVVDLNNFFLLRGKKLKFFTADCYKFSMSTLLENCQKLESLILKRIHFEQMDNRVTKTLNQLRNLELDMIDFNDNHCTESVAALLNSSPNLETLSLFHCDFLESEIVAKLSTFSLKCNLKHLIFVYSDVGVDLLQQIILNCNSLQSLSLDNCENISSYDVENLNHTIEASNRKIEINFNDDQSDFSYSDYEFDYDADYDVYEGFDIDYNDYDYDQDDDYDCDDEDGFVNHDYV